MKYFRASRELKKLWIKILPTNSSWIQKNGSKHSEIERSCIHNSDQEIMDIQLMIAQSQMKKFWKQKTWIEGFQTQSCSKNSQIKRFGSKIHIKEFYSRIKNSLDQGIMDQKVMDQELLNQEVLNQDVLNQVVLHQGFLNQEILNKGVLN